MTEIEISEVAVRAAYETFAPKPVFPTPRDIREALGAALPALEAQLRSKIADEMEALRAENASLREHALADNPKLRALHDNAVLYLDAVEALQEARDGAPLSTTIGWMIRQKLLVPAAENAE